MADDAVARDVLVANAAINAKLGAGGLESVGAAMFKGWLVDNQGTAVLYTDSQLMEWLEIPSADILHRIDGTLSLDVEERSLIWVRRDASIKRCQAGLAHEIAELHLRTADDPTATRPRSI